MTEEQREAKTVSEMLFFVLAGLIGICMIFLPLPGNIVVVGFMVGIALTVVGVAIAVKFLYVSDKKFRENKCGALWIWSVCLLAIVTLALGWFSLTWPTYMIIEIIEGIYDFPPEATSAIDLIKNVIGWFLILMSLGLLLWAFVNSQRREELTYPM